MHSIIIDLMRLYETMNSIRILQSPKGVNKIKTRSPEAKGNAKSIDAGMAFYGARGISCAARGFGRNLLTAGNEKHQHTA